MDYRQMSARLLARLRKETNGAVVGDMEERGLCYGRNYGVSQYAIRRVAREFGPDHEFAKYLWQQPIRELKIAAAAIAEPERITPNELKFWFSGVGNSELAENIASFVLSRTFLAAEILEHYGNSDDPQQLYAAVLSAARGNAADIPAEKIIPAVEKIAETGSLMSFRAAGLLLSKAAGAGDPQLLQYIDSLRSRTGTSYSAILNEMMI